jgi:hypothetical protein
MKLYPVLLEAVLGAKITVVDAELQTCWALQSPSLVFAVVPRAVLPGVRHSRDDLRFDLK